MNSAIKTSNLTYYKQIKYSFKTESDSLKITIN